jgi:hypothetical protein
MPRVHLVASLLKHWTDNLSGIDFCSAPVTFTNEGTGQTATGTCTDKAGNVSAPVTARVNIDKTPPAISGMPGAGCRLWPPNHKLVQVATVTAKDALSGLAPGSFKVTGTSNEPIDPSDPAIVITPTSFAWIHGPTPGGSVGEWHGEDLQADGYRERSGGQYGDSDGNVDGTARSGKVTSESAGGMVKGATRDVAHYGVASLTGAQPMASFTFRF